MFRRVSLVIDQTVYKKIIKLQAKRIRKTKGSCSFSKMVNLILIRGIKKIKKR